MTQLTELNAEQEALLDVVYQEYDSELDKPRGTVDLAFVKAWLAVAYKACDTPMPERVEVVDSPKAACALATRLIREEGKSPDPKAPEQTATDHCGVSEMGWVSFYDYFHRIDVVTADEAADTLALRDFFVKGRCWDTILLDECAIVVRLPELKRDQRGNLHSETGPAVSWADGNRDYAWHGVFVPDRLILDPKSFTRDEYEKMSTEVQRALGEKAGWEWLCDLLGGAKPVDEWTDPKTSLRYTLLAGEDGAKWLKKQSPVLQAGNQPEYLEPVARDLEHAQAARKWQAVRLTVEECEKDPELEYVEET